MDLRVQVLGLSYFSIEIVLGLRRHTLWSFWVGLREEGYAPPVSPVALPGVPKSDRRLVWRRRRFFLFRPSMITVLDVMRRWGPFASALGSVALSATVIISIILLCYVICLILEISFSYMIVLSTCPLHPLPGWYDMVAELRLFRGWTGATPCVR